MSSSFYEDMENNISLTVNIGYLSQGTLLKGHTVLITGATSGIGYEMAKKFISQGANVIVSGIEREKFADISKELGDGCKTAYLDMTDVASFDGFFIEADALFGSIDCLVNNAGISLHEGDFMNVTEKTWDAQFDINLKGVYFLTQAWIRYYKQKDLKSGRVVMMASDTSGMGCSIPYGLSKVGIASLTHGLAKRFITDGIRINALGPGTTLTPMTFDFTAGKVCRSTTQGKRALFPQEIAEVATFLLSDLSACVSGNIFGCSESNICFDNMNREQETNP